jgi:uncharacterized protein (DUF1778 family)
MKPGRPHNSQENRATIELPAEQTCILLNSEHWAAFVAALDAPPVRMERLLTEPTILD